jgi:threonyl-tRNA synthetase
MVHPRWTDFSTIWPCIGMINFSTSPANRSSVSLEDYKPLEKIAESAIQEKQSFQRLDLDKNTLLEMFKYSKYKVHFIKDKIPDGGSTTVYRCGPLIDLCMGPHIPHTGRIKAFSVMKVHSLFSQVPSSQLEFGGVLAW